MINQDYITLEEKLSWACMKRKLSRKTKYRIKVAIYFVILFGLFILAESMCLK